MTQAVNRQWCLAARPTGAVREDHFRMRTVPVPVPGEGQFLVRTHYLSVAPVMRRYMIDGAGIEKAVEIGEVMLGRGAGVIVASNNPDWPVGTRVQGKLGWQDYAVADGAPGSLMFRVEQTAAPLSTALGVLGITGFTAYCALKDIGRPQTGETCVVSGAAGGVGSIAVQVARLMGCRVIGIAGSPEKCRMLTDDLGCDAAIDYRTEDVTARLRDLAPDGVDIFFDNVGGAVLDAVLPRLARYARVISCGRISQYLRDGPYALKNWEELGAKRALFQGFFVYDYEPLFAEAERVMAGWIADGRLTYREDVLTGLESMPKALIRLYEGRNMGKQIVKVVRDCDG